MMYTLQKQVFIFTVLWCSLLLGYSAPLAKDKNVDQKKNKHRPQKVQETVHPKKISSPTETVKLPATKGLLKLIREAQTLIEPIELADEEQFVIVLNKAGTQQLVQLRMTKKEDFRTDCNKQKSPYNRFIVDDPKSPFKINATNFNGVNTNFVVENPPGYFVVALKYPVKHLYGHSKRHVIYTPYEENIDTPELWQAGQSYLTQIRQHALQDLQQRKVSSRALENSTVTDVIRQGELEQLITIIAIIEHMDHTPYFAQKKNSRGCWYRGGSLKDDAQLTKIMEKQIRQALVIYGANQSWAYSYAVSRVAAGGPMQIWPRSLQRMQGLYTEAGLNSNIYTDHLNSFKAAILHLDMELIGLGERFRLDLFRQRPTMDIYGILAAGYNSNAANIGKRLQVGLVHLWRNKMPKETKIYIKKTAIVRNWLNKNLNHVAEM